MIVDPTTLLFSDLTDDDVIDLKHELDRLIWGGEVNWSSRFLIAWCEAGGYDDAQKLLLVSTVYPVRALYSILER